MPPRVVETNSDSDDEFWDAKDEKWWSLASNDASVNNSPVKAGLNSNLPSEPSTPVSSGLAESIQERLNLKSGGARFENGSPTKMRSNSVAYGSRDSRVFPQSPSLQIRTRSAEESTFSNADSTPYSTKQGTSSRSLADSIETSPAPRLTRLASLKEVYLSNKSNSKDNTPTRTKNGGSSSSVGTHGSVRGSSAYGSKLMAAPSDIISDSDVEMDEHEVEQMVDTDTESSVPSTRQNSMLFPSRTTSTTSVMTDISVSSGYGRRKRSLDHQDGPPSTPITPPKMRRTMDGPQVRMDPPLSLPELSRASTVPIPTTQRLYPLPKDEESVFRPSPVKSATIDSPLPKLKSSISKPVTSSSKVTISPSNTATQQTRPQSIAQCGANSTSSSDNPALDFSFLDHAEGGDLPLSIIAHDKDVQLLMDSMQISWGVQWEIARGVSKNVWKWSDVTREKLDLLKGRNAEAAPKVAHVMKTGEVPPALPRNVELWREMDREQSAILENCGRGLGLMGEWEGEPNWWGGRIQQIIRLAKAPSGSPERYVAHMERLESRRSNRIARFLGSRRVGQMRVDTELMNKERDELLNFLLRSFVLCGRVFRPFASKDGSLYLMETNLDFERTANEKFGDQHRISFAQFVNWHNPLHLNNKQPISKWSTRWSLGLSTSRPVLAFKEENIHDDRHLRDPEQPNAPTEKIFTDGCGLINEAALTAIWNSDIVKLPHRPVAIQGRIAGAKGMWGINPTDQSHEPSVSIRPSQNKINLLTPLHRSHLILDLVSPSRVSMPSRLSMQTITCLSHNGVPDSAFKALIEKELDAIILPLTDWDNPSSMLTVAKAIERAGHITGTRLSRFAGGSTKALGLSRDFHRDEDDSDQFDDGDIFNNTTVSGRESFSEAPRSVFESAYELIIAGFHPLRLKLLYDKMQKIVTYVIDNFVKNLHIPVSESVEAFIIPDPKGVLKEGQIYFCSSQNLRTESGAIFHVVTGPVIVGRNPTRLPSDLQMVDAVDHPELHGWYDVIIFSTEGERSLASLLAGGDYDGDTVMMFWAKLLLEHFRNSAFCEPPADLLTRNFHREVETVANFCQRVSRQPSTSQYEFQKVLLLGLIDAKVGLYSVFHDNAVYQFGYASKEAVRMAYMFNTCLDSPKTGHRLQHDIFKEDQAKYGRPRPSCMVPIDHAESAIQTSQSTLPVERNKSLGTFILDSLVTAGHEIRTRHLKAYDRHLTSLDQRLDEDLMKPLKAAQKRAKQMKEQKYPKFSEELDAVDVHVKHVRTLYQKFWATPRKPSSSRTTKGNSRKELDAAASDIARQFVAGPPGYADFLTPDLTAIKASHAYSLSASFGFAMAYRDLCTIKAMASEHVPTARTFAETMSIAPSFLRVLGENNGE